MNSTSLRPLGRRVLPGIAALALGLTVAACGAGNEAQSGTSGSGSDLSGKLNGAGSSAQESAMDAWRAGFQKANPDVTINYDPAGSGAGVEKFNAGGVDFAGSDSALDADTEIAAARQRCGGDAIEVPDYVSPIAMIYNLDGVDDLQLSAKTAAQIFAGKITTWDDPAIKAENPEAALPSAPIKPVHRSDDSGTTENFTDYLSQASEGAWAPEASKTWPFKSGEAGNQTSGMVAAVKQAQGSIGYADDSQAGGLGKASIKVGDQYVAPSADGAAKALEASPVAAGRPANDLAIEVDRTTTTPGAYPLMLTSYLIACPTYDSAATADVVKDFLTYVISADGQQAAADNAGSAPLPPSLQEKAQAIVDTIAAK